MYYVPAILASVFLFVIVSSRKYMKTNVPCANRFCKIVKALSIQTVLLAALCSASALLLSSLNPFCHGENIWHILCIGSGMAGILFHYENVYLEQVFYFPIIQTSKYSMFMSRLSEYILKSMKKSIAYEFFVLIPLYMIEPKSCIHVYFLVTLWFSISLILFLFYSFEHIVYLTMTERVIFPITTINQDSNSLLNALSNDNNIIKSLALYDLYQATINDTKRRKEIFSLSFAGNVPQSWKIIFNYCINNIKTTTNNTSNLVKQVSPKLINRRIVPNARLIQINDGKITKQDEENVNKQSKLLKFFERFHAYNYFFGPLEKENTEEYEAVVWCCYILSNLAVVSLKEDEYGIIREQLGQIVGAILDLKNKLELQRGYFDGHKTKMTEYLKVHVKTCTVMLALHFGMYASDIGLDETQLHNFKKIISLLNDI